MVLKPDPFPWLGNIEFCRLKLYFQAVSYGRVDWFLGPEVRGGIGPMFKRYIGCDGQGNEDCDACRVETKNNCPYAALYVHGGSGSKGMVLGIEPTHNGLKSVFRKDDALSVEIRLIGKNMRLASHLSAALAKGHLRLGDRGAAFELKDAFHAKTDGGASPVSGNTGPPSIRLEDCLSIHGNIEDTGGVEVHFATPAEITITHRRQVKSPEELTFKTLVRSLIRNTRAAAYEHCSYAGPARGGEISAVRALVERAGDVILADCDAVRGIVVPIRNKAERNAVRIVGAVRYSGDTAPYHALLEAGKWLGVGKGTTFGFGKMVYRQL